MRVPSTREFIKFNNEKIDIKGVKNHKKIYWHLPKLTERMRRKLLMGGQKGNGDENEEAPYWARQYAATYLKHLADTIYEFLDVRPDNEIQDKEDEEHRFLD